MVSRRDQTASMAPAAPAQESMSPTRPQAGNQAAQERLKAAAAGRDPQGKKGALPFRDKLKSSMGIDFAGAAAIFGAKDALAGEGAKAAQVGKTMLFAEERPSLETVAHEAAHFAQREKGGATSPGTDTGGGLAEEEAHDAADAVVKGETATLEAPAEAAVHRLAEPNPIVEDPTSQAYVDPTNPTIISDTTADPTDSGAGSGTGGQVVIKSTEAAPVVSEATPSAVALYEEVAQGGTPYATQRFTVDSPLALSGLHPDRLYIDGAPAVEDIRQGDLGDCYFLAALTSVVAGDPGHLMSIISLQGDFITANLWEVTGKESNGELSWAPCTIAMDRSLLVDTEAGRVVGAKIRTSDTLSERRWWAEFEGDELMVRSHDLYEAALWAPLMEKAYAIFAEAHGQDGTGSTGKGGTKAIGNGGTNALATAVLYGPNIVGSQETTWMPTDSPQNTLDADHIPTLKGLAAIQPSTDDSCEPQSTTLVQAGTNTRDLFKKLAQDVDRAKEMPETEDLDVTWLLLKLEGAAYIYVASHESAADILLEASHSPHWDALEAAGLPWQDLHETVDTLATTSKDWTSSGGKNQEDTSLNLMTPHGYAVLSAEFTDRACAPLAVTPDTVEQFLTKIDPQSSSISLRNPHGTGEPTTHGTDQKDDGIFTMTLHQYLHSFSHQTVTQVSA